MSGIMSRVELMQILGLKDRKSFAKNYLLPALHFKVIEMTLPDKPQSSNQRYRVTENGIRAIK
jgi:ATP-dependent DNA helicase RecG